MPRTRNKIRERERVFRKRDDLGRELPELKDAIDKAWKEQTSDSESNRIPKESK